MLQTALEQAITEALEQARTELMRLYADGDVGTVCIHVGHRQLRVKTTPERTRDPVRVDSNT
jgi:hypothetical protein